METPMNTDDAMYISLNQAAKKWGKSKGTISKMASSGRLQWHDMPNGERKLSLSQLAHQFGPPQSEQEKQVAEQVKGTSSEHSETAGNAIENSRLAAELNAAREKIEMLQSQLQRERQLLEDQLERERRNADAWQHQAEQSQALLALPAPANHNEDKPARKASWFQRLTGKATA